MKTLTLDFQTLARMAREEHRIVAAFYSAAAARDAANAEFVARYAADGQADITATNVAIAAFVAAEDAAWRLMALPIAEIVRRVPVNARTVRLWCKNADEQIPRLRCELRSDGWYAYLSDIVSIIATKME